MEPPRVLFLCIGNMCRSPMAEAIARGLGDGRIEALSAGLSPSGRVDPNTVAALAELGYPTEGLHSKPITEMDLHDVDVIVSLVGDQGLAVLPRNLGAQRVAWSIHDPLGEDLEAFVATAELLERKIRALVEGLLGGVADPAPVPNLRTPPEPGDPARARHILCGIGGMAADAADNLPRDGTPTRSRGLTRRTATATVRGKLWG